MASGTFLPEAVGDPSPGFGGWKTASIHGCTVGKNQSSFADRTRLNCVNFGWNSTWATTVASPYAGRASLEYLKKHPEESSAVHVVM